MKRVVIFTANSVDKIHPRIEMEQRILTNDGYQVTVKRTITKREGLFWELLNLLCLKYFKLRAIRNFSHCLNEYDIIHIYDLQLLPIAKRAKKKGKIVFYETLDDNVYLNFHAVSQKLFFLRPFKKLITGKMERWERRFSKEFCDKIIVNSPNLTEKFDSEKVIYLPYASPLEELELKGFDPNKETVFVYLGKLTVAKGAIQYAQLMKTYQLSMFFFGKAYDRDSIELTKNERVHSMGNLGMKDLKSELAGLFEKFNPVGLSIIIPENESYALQEANKDIDYISMGIPFIGNDRKPTLEKISKGAGVLWNDNKAIEKLLSNAEGFYDQCVQACKIEAEKYSEKNFISILKKTYSSPKEG